MVYLDNNATTPLHPSVKEKMIEVMDIYGNPSSVHQLGRQASFIIEETRKNIADFLGCDTDEIIFTASGSESNNTVLKSVAGCCGNCSVKESRPHIITSNIEHPSVMNTLKTMEESGNISVTYVKCDKFGMIHPDEVKKAIKKETVLISIMFANNETGAIQPLDEISKLAADRNIAFHTDAVQAVGKIPINLKELKIDFLSLSGHKIYAPKGIGVLYKRKGNRGFFCPLISGGHQEQALRAGTENTISIAAIGEAFRCLSEEMEEEVVRLKKMRDRFMNETMKQLDNVTLNGPVEKRLPGTVNLSFNNVEGEAILLRLDMFGIEVSTGSACSSGSLEPSYVITALGVEPESAHSSIRFSFGRENTEEDVDKTIEAVVETIKFLRMMSPIA